MRSKRRLARHVLVATAILILALMPAAGRATDLSTDPAVIPSGDPGGDIDRWWGAVGAAICGTEIRLMWRVPEIGFNPYVMAAGIGGCILAAMDVMTTN